MNLDHVLRKTYTEGLSKAATQFGLLKPAPAKLPLSFPDALRVAHEAVGLYQQDDGHGPFTLESAVQGVCSGWGGFPRVVGGTPEGRAELKRLTELAEHLYAESRNPDPTV